LRLRAAFAWRLEVRLDESYLYLRIRAADHERRLALPLHLDARKSIDTGDCSTCDKHACHRYTGTRQLSPHRTWLIDEQWPEFQSYLAAHRDASGRVLGVAGGRADSVASRLSRLRAWLRWRIALWRKLPIPQARNRRLEIIASAMMSRLHPDDLHLVVSQGLLPYLWQAGELAGRRFDVLMSALPMTAIQKQLDAAATRHPGSATLRDFRAPSWLIDAETAALAQANRWVSPHAQVLAMAGSRGVPLPGRMAAAKPELPRPPRTATAKLQVFFPASSLARKGALELREAVRDLPVSLVLLGNTEESADFWRGFEVGRASSMKEGVATADIVVLPAWVEHQPRGLLLAMERGIPVIATDACGLPESPAWKRVPAGDDVALRNEIRHALDAFEARADLAAAG
jgi:hypothetical protein